MFLAEHFRNTDRTTEVYLSLARQNKDIEAFRETGLPIVTLDRPSLSNLWRRAWLLPQQLRDHGETLASFKPHAVIITMNSPFAWPFIILLQRRGLKVIYVAHDAEPHPGDYARTWQRASQDLLIRKADRVVALSGSVADRIAGRIPIAARKISVIPLETIFPTKRAQLPDLPTASQPVRLLFFGRLLPYKGLDLMAQALAPLRTNPNWTLTIAGSGPLEADVRGTFGDWPQVDLELGWISGKRADELYASHHLLLCPYNEASQSGSISHAISWAVPSLVTPTGALPEQIGFGTAGVVADSMDADGFRRGLQQILEDPGSLINLSRGAARLLAERRANLSWFKLIQATAEAEADGYSCD